MKRILTIFAILSLIGAATGLPNFGPAQGFHNRGDISMGGDLTVGDDADVVGDLTAGTITSDAGITATTEVLAADGNFTDDLVVGDDLDVTDDAAIGGDLTVTGSASFGGGYIASGSITDDLEMAAGKDLTCDTGASLFDWSKGTGIFKTTTGEVTIGGGTNSITLSGPVTGASAKNWTMVGASLLTIGSLGIEAVGDTINFLDAVAGTSATFSGAVATGAQTVTGGVTATGTIQAEQITSTDDMTVNDDLNVLGDMAVAGSFTIDDIVATDDLTVGGDADVVGDLTAGTITSDAGITATGTVSLNGDTTVATAKTLAVTDADALTVGGAIVPQEEVIVWKIDASSVDENIFIAADAWNITHIEEVHAVAGSHGDSVTLMVRVCDGTETPANGDAAQNATIDLKGTANTVQAAALSATKTLADGDRIALDYTGNLTALAGGVVTVHMARA